MEWQVSMINWGIQVQTFFVIDRMRKLKSNKINIFEESNRLGGISSTNDTQTIYY